MKHIDKEGAARGAIQGSRNMLVAWYLMCSYLYYVRDTSIVSDGFFDELTRQLDAEWDSLDHRHKPLIDRAWLKAGTCMLADTDYPTLVRNAACSLADISWPGKPLPRIATVAPTAPVIRRRARPQ